MRCLSAEFLFRRHFSAIDSVPIQSQRVDEHCKASYTLLETRSSHLRPLCVDAARPTGQAADVPNGMHAH